MSADSRRALARISEIRGCSLDQAKQYCVRIRELQEGEKSSWVEISQGLLWMDEQKEDYTDREVAAKAKAVTGGSKLPQAEDTTEEPGQDFSVSVERPEIRKFKGPDQHQPFLDWIDRYVSQGYVLNLMMRGKLVPMLHTANCHHLKPSPDHEGYATTRVKLCSTHRTELRRKGKRLADEKLELCGDCDV